MKTLKYEIQIGSTKEIVWNTIISKQAYGKWSKVFSPNCESVGEWKQGAEIMFFDGSNGGCVAKIDTFKSFERIMMTYIGTITSHKVSSINDPMTEKWIGSKQNYELESLGDQTVLRVTMQVDEVFKEMLDKSWPQALENIKKLSEK